MNWDKIASLWYRAHWAGRLVAFFVIGVAVAPMDGCVGTRFAQAQTPNPVTPGYQICQSTQTGVTQCAFQPLDLTHPLPVSLGLPGGGITGNATGTTGAVVGTLAGATGKTTYICGFDVTAVGGTAQVGPVTVAGLVTSSAVYYLASSAAGSVLPIRYSPCIPASATNTAITITTTANGTASAVTVNSWGYQQ